MNHCSSLLLRTLTFITPMKFIRALNPRSEVKLGVLAESQGGSIHSASLLESLISILLPCLKDFFFFNEGKYIRNLGKNT